MKRITLKSVALLTGFLAATAPVMAAQSTANLAVTATVADTCAITATTALAFATIDGGSVTDETVNGVLTVVCTSAKTGVTVDMAGGNNASGGQRRMSDGGTAFLPYNIHSDSGHASEVAIDGEIYNGNVSAAVPLLISVYGQIPSGSYTAGVYTDTILVTLTY